MNQVKFYETLKKLGFSRVNKYSPADFDSSFANPLLIPLLEYVCTLDEKNILTSDELKEYNSITPFEMKELEKLATIESLHLKEEKEVEKEEQEEYLKERLNHLDRRYKTAENQRELLLKQEALLLKEKAKGETTNHSLRRLYDDFSINKVPQAEAELSSTLESVAELVSELEIAADVLKEEDKLLPFLNRQDIEEYLEEEEKLKNLTYNYLMKNVQFTDESKTQLSIPGISNKKMCFELQLLNKCLKTSRLTELKYMCSHIKTSNAVTLVKEIEAGHFDYVLQMSPIWLKNKFNEQSKQLENLKEKEALLLSNISMAVNERVDFQCQELAALRRTEKTVLYKNNLQTLLTPLHYMLNQRARLDLLSTFIKLHQDHWFETKTLLDQLSHFVEKEKASYSKRMKQIEEFMKKPEVDETKLGPDSIFYTAYKVLSDVGEEDKKSISFSDLVKRIENLCDQKKYSLKQTEENNNVIRNLEKQYSEFEEFISKGVDFEAFLCLESKFSSKINSVEVLLQDRYNILKDLETEWQQKNQLIESQRNMKLSRNLFILALLQWDGFLRAINKIKVMQNHRLSSEKERFYTP